jgi:hypothetical protein
LKDEQGEKIAPYVLSDTKVIWIKRELPETSEESRKKRKYKE